MSTLVNRVPTGRIISLHAELCYLYWRFKDSSFSLQEMKLDPILEKTQLDFFPLAISNPKYGRYNGKYDPYLDNPLDKAGFHLTQSTERDSQKSKSVSECFSALEGLGWIARTEGNKGIITKLGKEAVQLNYSDPAFIKIIKKSVLNYGPFVGLLFECYRKSNNKKIKRKQIIIGYTNTNETLEVDGRSIPISTGSQDDSITRTRSTLLAWAMTAGYVWPVGHAIPSPLDWHNEALNLLKHKKWTWTEFFVFVSDVFESEKNIVIDRTLTYKSMTKSTKALREKGQDKIRSATLQIESKLKNRRFGLIYILALCAKNNKKINFKDLVNSLLEFPDFFVINKKNFSKVILMELEQMSVTSGIVFLEDQNILTPLVSCDIDYLKSDAPTELVDTLNNIYEKIKYE